MLKKVALKRKILLLISTICLSLSLIFIIITPQASGFEKSLYSGFPRLFWVLFISSIVLNSIFILLSSFQTPNKRYLGLSFFILFLAFLVFFLLPYFRGYALLGRGAADALGHIGHTKTILKTNHIGADNWYPISHLLMAQFNMMGISFELSRALITFSFTIQYIIFAVLYVRELEEKFKSFPILLVVFPLLYSSFHVSFHPAIMSFFTLPSLLYLSRKIKTIEYSIRLYLIIVLFLFFVVFFHPATTVLLILIFSIYYLSSKLYNHFVYEKENDPSYMMIVLILFLSFYLWYFRFSKMEMVVRSRINKIFLGIEGKSLVSYHSQQFSETSLPLIQRVISFFDLWGPIFIYGCVAFLFILCFIREYLSKKTITYPKLSISLQFLGGIIFGLVSLNINLVGFDVVRAGRWAIFFATLIIGLGFSKKIKNLKLTNEKTKKRKNYLVLLIIFFIITSVFILSIYDVYDTNNHLTYSEKYGDKWYIENANYQEKELIESGTRYKMVHYLCGAHTSIERGQIFGSGRFKHPHRLGYEENDTAAETFNKTVYMITKPWDYTRHEDWHQAHFEANDYYLKEDLEKLEDDPTVNKLYSNGEFVVWDVTEN